MVIIKLKDLHKIYDESGTPVHALKGISLEIEKGEFISIVGPSGSGKTTLLNLIGGLDTPTSGSVIIEGKDITKFSSKELVLFRLYNIGFVFQDYSLLPVLTAKENVEMPMLLQGLPKREYERRAVEVLEKVGLKDKMNHKPSQLSGGEQQRIAVARAIAPKPKFILADEPTANLDSASAENLLEIMRQLNQDEGTTFIFSTHDPRVVAKARRVITLKDGEITSDEIQNR
jgi:putative ABC transport system ATP-binding protein